ncbi:subtilase-type protease inhibitor [Streptomyces californicus]|uniref:Probable subtilase-type protease inhibitor n=1 Tax=Streptomyces californicus TaxID=67351 RepID=A0ABD7CR91_9ACTN|nr:MULTISPECIES: subtilase-type protease inhibitor [Streptomyces]QRV31564.1 subtilase-type protease inhibitor [Streptomyces californicus]QRV32826.1 subtilase-type protease inhibitor [Streptomyces californicus]QRV44981.1 subtilase-type protease inhibitor [Streptomyces californicus]QRV51670.1 subtilase-type protease inhibitor [Streptomyces californicus]
MRRIPHATFATLAAGALLLGGLAAATAQAAPARAKSLYAPSALVLGVARGEDPLTATVERAVTLSCAPTATGTHPDPVAACKELAEVRGQFSELAAGPSNRTCTRQWDPIVVTADGVWQGKPVRFSTTYGNACEMAGSTNGHTVFAF